MPNPTEISLLNYNFVKKAVYIAIGIDMDGKKDVLGMYVGVKGEMNG